MEFMVLGPVELRDAERQLDLGSAKARCVLAVLLLNLGIVVPTEVLIGRVWDETPPPKARESLSIYVTRLRRVLREAEGERARVVARAHGYLLDADPADVDLYQFRRMRRQAHALAMGGERERAAALFSEADALWRGQALAGLPGDSMARMRQSLEEERRAAILERIECDLALGRHAELLGELQQLSVLYPMDESLAASQMTALYRSGRPSDALGVYRDARSRLVSEQGAEPGAALSELHERILRGDPVLTGTPSLQLTAGLPALDTLPPEAGEFVGRAEEIGRLTAGGAAVRVITGMPGIGKTALAVQAARALQDHYPGGQLFLSFCTNDPRNPPLNPADALHRLLRMLGVPVDSIPMGLADRAALWRAELARRRMIVVLDDVAGPDQVRPLLPGPGECLTLITSRAQLDGLGEATVLTLGALADDDAFDLFTRIAGLEEPSGTGQVAQGVQLCGGLPLAIQLTARWLRRGRPAALSDLLEELSRPPGRWAETGMPGREIMAAFEVSYRALPVDSQRFFRCLGLHPGTDITDHAAAALAGKSLAEAQEALAALLDLHLVEPAGRYFRFHDLIRQYAGVCAARDEPEPDRRQALDRLLDYYLHSAGQADRLLYPYARRAPQVRTRQLTAAPDLDTPERAADWMELEWRSILSTARRAAAHERKRHCAELTRMLAGFMEDAGHWNEAGRAHALALQACRDLDDPPGIALVSLDLSRVTGRTGHHQDALRHAGRAADIYQALADQGGQAAALDQIGAMHRLSARYREALAYHQEAGDLYRAAGDLRGVAGTLNDTAIAHYHLGRYQRALEHLQAALALYRQASDRRGEAKTLNNLGNMQRYQGYHRDALNSYRSALKIFQEIGGEQSQAILLENIGCIQHYKRNYEEALASYRRALAISRRIGNLPGETGTLNEIGVTLNALEEYTDALAHHQRASLIAGELGDSYEQAIALRGMGDACRGEGRHDQAADHYQHALRLAREIGEPFQEGKALDGLAETALQTQDPGAARIYWHQALDVYQQLGVPEAETVRLHLDTLPPQPARDIARPPPRPAGRPLSNRPITQGERGDSD